MADGNTTGKVVGDVASLGNSSGSANPPVKRRYATPPTDAAAPVGDNVYALTPLPPPPAPDASKNAIAALQTTLDGVGLIPGVGILPDLGSAAISACQGDWLGAGLSVAGVIPFAGGASVAAKVARRGKILAKEAREAKLAKKELKEALERKGKLEAERKAAEKKAREEAEKRAAEKKVQEKAEQDAAERDATKKRDSQVKKKEKMKCGEYGKYSKLKQKTGEGKFDRDHIPAKSALKKRAEELLGRPLKPSEATSIDNAGATIAIPRQAHIDVSPTYGQTLSEASKDAKNLAGSARRDVEAMLKKIDEYDADGGCKKAYKKGAKKILRMSNEDFDKFLIDAIKKAK